MNPSTSPRPGAAATRRSRVAAAVLALLVLPCAAAAQDGFLFGPPIAGITVRAGPMLYATGGDLFGQFQRDLTLDRGDFRAPALGVDVLFTPLSRVDLVVGIATSESSRRSEFRDWVDQDGHAIEQSTRLRTLPVTLSARYLLLPRGRSISSVAWLPRSTTPYIGIGAGVAWYRLEQDGDFIDSRDYSIYRDYLHISGSRGIVHALLGADHWLTPRIGVNAEARYTRGHAVPDGAFRSFDNLDLSGVHAALGVSFRW